MLVNRVRQRTWRDRSRQKGGLSVLRALGVAGSALTRAKMSAACPQASGLPRYIDIGINLTDPVYQGIYNGTPRHPADLAAVIERSKRVHCHHLIVTGSDLASSHAAVALAKAYPGTCYATVGIHPCSSQQFILGPTPASEQLHALETLARTAQNSGHAVAFGEIGLDYDRLALSPKETQNTVFARQLDLAVALQLPLFLHSRAAHADFMAALCPRESQLPRRGVVHSFTGTLAEMEELVAHGWHIGLNGCSLKTEANCAVARAVPLDRLHLETDGPWCELRPSHAGARALADIDGLQEPDLTRWLKKEKWQEGACVKGRNEPCCIPKIAAAIASIKDLPLFTITEAAWTNSQRMFCLNDPVVAPRS
ncbi:unnamed protein product [Blumeria hordei]|uniref:Uncharacterized protein n=1 Tax=Blumeria hordei TaxID=2867405 RepID=A0A383UMS8_BLUHO|nr:unnamed protein product [Blumeria hordei]